MNQTPQTKTQKEGAFCITGIWRPTVNSRNIITLVPFGSIQCMYEVSDVEQIPNRPCTPKDDILELLQTATFPATEQQEEFEAETVAWLVCKRHGVSNPSEKYLTGYIKDGLVPECSPDSIMRAVTEIEKMLKKPLMAKQTIRYKEDKGFKEQVDQLLQALKNNR